MSNLPAPVEHRYPAVPSSLVRAAYSPTAVAVTAVGVGIGVADHSVIVAVVLGAGAWCGRMVAAVVARARRRKAAQPRPASLDPYSVPDPWRQLVRQAVDAQTRFDGSVADWPPGPIRDRLSDLQPRLWADIETIGSIARRGAALSGWNAGVAGNGRPSPEALADELRRTQAQRQVLGDSAPSRAAALERSEEALAAQIRSLHRAGEAEAAVADRLRVIVARLDDTVTSLLLLGTDGADLQPESLIESLGDINDEVTSLSTGLAVASGASQPALMDDPPPPTPPTS